MNDADALARIRTALDEYFRGQADHHEAIQRIAYITRLNGGAK